jgi:hypothetical protein
MFHVIATRRIKGNGKMEYEINEKLDKCRVRNNKSYQDFDLDNYEFAIKLFWVL